MQTAKAAISRPVAAFFCLCLCIYCCGCGIIGSQQSAPSVSATVSPDGLVTKNQETWALATDPYVGSNNGMIVAVTETYIQICMNKQGLSYEVEPYSPSQGTSIVASGGGRLLFNEKIAAKYGYSVPREDSIQPRLDRWKKQDQQPQAWKQAQEKCSQEAVKEPLAQQIEHDGGISSSSAQHSEPEGLKEAAQRWRKCMEPLGITDLAEHPDGIPSKSLYDKFNGVSGEVQYKDPFVHPVTAYELKVATQDAKCRTESGYTKLQYEAEWSASYVYVQKHLSELTALRQKSQKIQAKAVKFLKANGNYVS